MVKTNMKVAVTLYNFRDYCLTEDDLARTLDRLAEIGYRYIQVSGVKLPAEVIRKRLDERSLTCVASHDSLDLIKDASALADRLDTLGCDYTALGSAPATMRTTSGMADLAATMNRQGEALLARGKRLGYHNHRFEFDRHDTDKILLRHFFDATDPRFVAAELDVYWVASGGGNPARWIRELKGRIPVIHFKDFAVVRDAQCYCEIGEGNLDWPEILAACRETGIGCCSIEQDQPFKNRDIFESTRISFNNLKAMNVGD